MSLLQIPENQFGVFQTEVFRLSIGVDDGDVGEGVLLHQAELDFLLFLNLVLEVGGEVLERLIRHHGQGVHLEAGDALALLVDADAQTAPDHLAAPHLAGDLVQRANLEDVRIVPPLLQRGMGEDELHRRVEGEQQGFVLHDQLVAALRVVLLRLGGFGGVNLAPLLVDGEVAVVNLFRKRRDVHVVEQRVVFWLADEARILLLEPPGVLSLDWIPVGIVFPIVAHAVDEEEAQHLDAKAAQLQFAFQVLLDGLADLQPFDGIVVRAAKHLIDSKRFRLVQEQDVLVTLFAADVIDLEPVIDAALARLLEQRVACLYLDGLADNRPLDQRI